MRLKDKVKLTKTRAKLFPYGSKEPLSLVGKFAAAISCSKSKGYDVARFFCCERNPEVPCWVQHRQCLLVS